MSKFVFSDIAIRLVMLGDQPWCMAADVLKAVGIGQYGGQFDLKTSEVQRLPSVLIAGKGLGLAKILSQTGLNRFLPRSDKPAAKTFQGWIVETVLPAI